ncbi:transglutaminase family protein [Sphingobacterium wenxiniae]|uniref:Transglutaminase-like enzyme, putative cysteine protease n=1 Tax=Sphingobacterium wenxiniae TaxID=683125 RepID=A0A1I6SCL6_9SPHI|nr:transglutaminase family protein [Sphingobacterium wenxiniae]SFS74580.1 Transglutaminase-like enzyme, putative cysteine protease [Sphingobacterium wenxiniae]
MAKFNIQHITTYTYDEPVYDSANQIMLYPIKDAYQEVVSHRIAITNDPLIETYTDYYGNQVGTFTNYESHNELNISSSLEVQVKSKLLPDDKLSVEKQWEIIDGLQYDMSYINFLKKEYFDAEDELLAVVLPEERRKSTPYEVAQYFCHYVFENFKYIKGITSVETTVDEIWKLKSGVCQDFAHILLVMLRRVGIPARYVSGYICPNQNGMRGEGATHAWVETFIPDYGWLGLDPTNNCIVQSNHVRLAVGRNFVDVSPVKGTYKGTAHHKLEVKVIISYENDPIPQENESKEALIVNPQFEGNSYQRFKEMQEMQQQ